MIAADIVNELESRYPCVQGGHQYYCPTGTPYESFFENAAVEEEAADLTMAAIRVYEAKVLAEKPPGAYLTLYWRYDAPHCFWYADDLPKHPRKYKRGAMKIRIALDWRPVVETSDAEYDATRTAELERDILTTPDRSQQ